MEHIKKKTSTRPVIHGIDFNLDNITPDLKARLEMEGKDRLETQLEHELGVAPEPVPQSRGYIKKDTK